MSFLGIHSNAPAPAPSQFDQAFSGIPNPQTGAPIIPATPAAAPTAPRMSAVDAWNKIGNALMMMSGPTSRQMVYDQQNQEMQQRLNQQKLEAGQNELSDDGLKKMAYMATAIDELQSGPTPKSPQEIAALIPQISQLAGLAPDKAAQFAQHYSADPIGTTKIMKAMIMAKAKASGGGAQFGLNPFYAKDAQGNLKAYQLGQDGSIHPVTLPDGQSPADPLKVIDTGDTQTIVGSRTGVPTRIMPKSGPVASGYRPVVNPQGQVVGQAPITGGPADPGTVDMPPIKEIAKRNAAYPVATTALRVSTQKIDAQIKRVSQLLKDPALSSFVGSLDALTPDFLPGTTRVKSIYGQVMANAQFNELQKLKQAGSTLGQVSDTEGRNLRQSATAMNRDQGEDSFRSAAQAYLEDLRSAKDNLQQAYDDTYAYRANMPRAPLTPRPTARPAASGWGKATVVKP